MYEKMGKERKPLKPGVLIPPWKGIFALSCSMFCLYISFEALQNLENSLNHEGNIGAISLALIYGTTALLSFCSSAAVYTFGVRVCLGFQVITHIIYVIGHFYPTSYVMIPVSILLGIGNSISLSTLGMYLTGIAHSYICMHDMAPEKIHGVSSMFNGIFFCFFKGTHIVGNLVSSLILSESRYNMTAVESNACGAMVCPKDYHDYSNIYSNTTHSSIVIVPPEERAVFTLLSVFIGFDVLGLLIIIFLTPIVNMSDLSKLLSKDNSETNKSLPSSSSSSPTSSKLRLSSEDDNADENIVSARDIIKTNIRDFWELLHDCRIWLLFPIFIGQAMVIMTMYTSYTEGFVSCTIGIQWVGYSMFFLGLSGALSSLFVNFFAKYTGRIPLFVFTTAIDFGCLITMLLWQPDHSMLPVQSFIIPVIAGISEGIFQPQQIVLNMSIFGEKGAAALSIVSATRALAFTATFFLMSATCLYTQFSVALAFYVIGFAGYLVIEFMEFRKTRQQSAHTHLKGLPDVTLYEKNDANENAYGSLSHPLASHVDGRNE